MFYSFHDKTPFNVSYLCTQLQYEFETYWTKSSNRAHISRLGNRIVRLKSAVAQNQLPQCLEVLLRRVVDVHDPLRLRDSRGRVGAVQGGPTGFYTGIESTG